MKKSTLYIFLFFALLFTSCKKYLDVNQNPNSPTEPPLNGLLGQATYQTALNVYRVGHITANYVQYFASSNTASSSDVYEPIDASGTWTNLYNVMTDIYDLNKLGAEQGSTEHQGVAKILMAINLKMAHDLWGSVPYSESFTSEKLTPVYDDAKTVYQQTLTLLDEGINLLKQTNSTFKISNTLDFMHHGSTSAWIKTAYALKARYLNLLSKQSDYNPDAILTALSSAYTSNADDAQVTEFDVRNPWAQVAVNNAGLLLDGWLSDQVINMMNGTTYGIFDPRLPLVADSTKFNDYRGTRNGKGRVGSGINYDESYLKLNGYYSSTNSPLMIISYSELKFIEAEARLRKNDKPGAYDAYLAGITANMNKLGVDPAKRDAYVNDPSVSVGEANITIDLIMKEKYKALFLNPETWNDARKYDYNYAGFQLPLNAVLPNYIRRLDYPTVETSRNSENVPGISGLDEKLWWDK
jgi:hypothetical protein